MNSISSVVANSNLKCVTDHMVSKAGNVPCTFLMGSGSNSSTRLPFPFVLRETTL
jgi:hypothetical protein